MATIADRMKEDQVPAARGNTPDESVHAPAPAEPAPVRRSRFANRPGVTADEREQPPGERQVLVDLERASMPGSVDQLPLFVPVADGTFTSSTEPLPALTADASLDLARTWYRLHLEQRKRPINTIDAYTHDLRVLERLIGHKALARIDRRDIARFLADASTRTTRKRRLTSARRFFRYLIDDVSVLGFDPTDGYVPHSISLRTPVPLNGPDQAAMLEAAAEDEEWSALAIWLMMRLGLTRSELLGLERDHIDRSSVTTPVVHIAYGDLARQSKERQLAGDSMLGELLDGFYAQRDPSGVLFPVGPPAVNGMVGRVARAAGIERDITPQTLRHTFAVEQARNGADRNALLALMGLADDARNRASVDRYIRLVAPPLAPVTDPRPDPG